MLERLNTDGLPMGKIITCTIEGILEMEDLQALAMGREVGEPAAMEEIDDPTDLKRIKEKHHSVARLVAGGMTQRMTALITGYTESYLSVLLNNPAMMELVENYRIRQGHATELITEKLRTVGMKALEKLETQVDAGELDANALISAAKLGLDRAGHAPMTKHAEVKETHVYDHAKLAELNAKARQGSASYIVPVRDVRKALPGPAVENEDEDS